MKKLLVGLLALVSLAWGWDVLVAGTATGGSLPWVARREAIYLSGLLSMALMSLAMFLAIRPAWLEKPFGGLDRMYRAHKWAGIFAGIFAALHWLIELSGGILKDMIGLEGRIPKVPRTGLSEIMHHLAKDMGEWAVYALLALLLLALWKRFPYRPWRFLHRVMPVLYMMLAFHTILMAPADYWTQPVGVLLALLLCAGLYGSVYTLAGRIGRARQVSGTITAVEHPAADILTVRCQLGSSWRGHRSGQFAFVTFDPKEGAHPFTIASADQGDRTISFQIKALGDYTGQLASRLRSGQAVKIEGPYGCFDLARRDPNARQVWIAGGIGVTPFLAWLESLQAHPEAAPAADLHYCTRDRDNDPFVPRLTQLCTALPGIHLHIHGDRQGNRLDATNIATGQNDARPAEIWFCGPRGLAESLAKGLRAAWHGKFRFHQEAFEMR